MAEVNVPACTTHGARPRALHSESFEGIVTVIEELIGTVSGVGTLSYSRCPYGYPFNFEGVVRALEDLNTSISGISSGSDLIAGSGIYIQPSGSSVEVGVNAVGEYGAAVSYSGSFIVVSGQLSSSSAVVSGIAGGNGITVTTSGDTAVISTNLRGEGTVDYRYDAGVGVVSGVLEAGSGIYISDTTKVNLLASGNGSVSILYDGSLAVISGTDTQGGGGGGGGGSGVSVTVSGEPGAGYAAGHLWFDINEGRLFVYASGNGVSDPAWYQTNAEAIASKGEAPPSGTGLNAPPRDGSIWFNSLMGSLFVYDAVTSGWYETGPSRSFAYGPAAPAPSTEGAGWYSTTDSALKVWDGSNWIST